MWNRSICAGLLSILISLSPVVQPAFAVPNAGWATAATVDGSDVWVNQQLLVAALRYFQTIASVQATLFQNRDRSAGRNSTLGSPQRSAFAARRIGLPGWPLTGACRFRRGFPDRRGLFSSAHPRGKSNDRAGRVRRPGASDLTGGRRGNSRERRSFGVPDCGGSGGPTRFAWPADQVARPRDKSRA